ncbi:isoprenylcysteine carboxylmethyltransferase family protein [Facklamia sp. DSM 111018]|uniref:Isoprenylcysteine carboxylmethyltransferase family protein n=1 Tax=Facklamia lactis TaxID=2749967 RepID=A0ABS0LN64_9LACT|nr:isoprenylcysteine carboxylmethyltransferase family protein [Facklamia lactis]MBG9979712.1 isoprenylcysteine carboxylmethyltransferase family protein [Facklamia lactis]MBG9985608.1 isoprenylcysteine carboxylmethyltransferase family protein [Facklamia lactis]
MRNQLLGILILMVFYGCYFAKMIRQKIKGIQTDQIGKGKEGYPKMIEITMRVFTALVVMIELVNIYCAYSALPGWASNIGAMMAIAGDLIFIVSVEHMKDSWRAGVSETDKTELVTEGIYQFSRNPAFVGFYLVYIGILLMFYSRLLLVVTLFTLLLFHCQIILVEEPFLIKTFGTAYLDYQKKVNRYIGRKNSQKVNNEGLKHDQRESNSEVEDHV